MQVARPHGPREVAGRCSGRHRHSGGSLGLGLPTARRCCSGGSTGRSVRAAAGREPGTGPPGSPRGRYEAAKRGFVPQEPRAAGPQLPTAQYATMLADPAAPPEPPAPCAELPASTPESPESPSSPSGGGADLTLQAASVQVKVGRWCGPSGGE